MEFGIIRRDPKQSVLVSTHQDFRTALAQKDKFGPGHEVIVLHAPQGMEDGHKKRQKAAQ
jgi:hypothetical protein